jgi:hypothetical protein
MPTHASTSMFRELFGDTPKIRVMEFLLLARELDHSIGAIAKGAGINRVTLFRIWNDIEKSKLVTHTRNIGNAKMFTLNKRNPYVASLMILFDNLLIKQPKMLIKSTARKISKL